MLTITQIHYIRELFYMKGKKYTEIKEMTGLNYRTIRKYVEQENFNEENHKAQRPNKSDVLRPIIKKWLQEDQTRHRKQRHTAKRVYERLQEEYADLLDVSDRTIRNLVKEEKEKIYGNQNPHLLLHHPGGEAQVDFGSLEAFENGARKKFHELVVSFPKSNAGFVVLTRSETREALLEGLLMIFHYIGYVPKALWFDQMSTAALRSRDEKGQLKAAEFITRFATHYGFAIKFCNPNSGHEKGNVENKVGALRRNLFVPEPVINNLKTFNKQLLIRCTERNKQIHYRLKQPIDTLFEQEQNQMTPVNKIPFDTARYEARKVNKYGLVEFSGSRYSASPKYVGQSVVLKIMAEEIDILSKDFSEPIAKHARLFTKGGESIQYIDFIDVIRTRPTALKYSGIYALLPKTWQEYLPTLDKENFSKALQALKLVLLEEDMAYADLVLQETKKHHSLSPNAITVTYRRLKENREIYNSALSLPSDLPSYKTDITQYDQLMGGDQQ